MQNLVIETFNTVFNSMLGAFAAIVLVVALCLRNKTDEKKRKFVAWLYFLVFIYFFVYKYQISLDKPYSVIQYEAGKGGFSWWSELPLNLCNITLIITPIAMFTDNRLLKSFIFYISPVGALLALLMPSVGFGGYSILLPRVAGFYTTHFFALIAGPMICALKLYRPDYKDIFKCFATFCVIGVLVLGVNIILRKTGINPYSNYFFLMNSDGNPILEIIFDLIPIPGLYLVPVGIILFIPLMYLETAIFALFKKKEAK